MSKHHKLPVAWTIHHRKPKVRGGTNEQRNLSRVLDHKHRAYHLLFREGNPEYIAMVLNRTWIDPDFEFIVQRRKK